MSAGLDHLREVTGNSVPDGERAHRRILSLALRRLPELLA